MKIQQADKVVEINTMSNWPMLVDLFVKWDYPEELLDEAKKNDGILLTVSDLTKVTDELSTWGIPWKRTL